MLNKDSSRIIRAMLARRKWSQRRLAREMNVSESVISRHLKGEVPIGYWVNAYLHHMNKEERANFAWAIQIEYDHREGIIASLLDALPGIIWREDDGECTFVSDRWFELTGQTPDEALGRGYEKCIHRGDAKRLRRIYEDAMKRKRPFIARYRLKTVSGKFISIVSRGEPVFSDGTLVGFVGIAFPIGNPKTA